MEAALTVADLDMLLEMSLCEAYFRRGDWSPEGSAADRTADRWLKESGLARFGLRSVGCPGALAARSRCNEDFWMNWAWQTGSGYSIADRVSSRSRSPAAITCQLAKGYG
jgi:hypothetical protein